MNDAPILIVGQGLAGTALAWRLWERGVGFVIVDRAEPVTSSKIAAGLFTPVTGKRLTLSPDYGARFLEALKFYRAKERLLAQTFVHACDFVRLFKNDEEPVRWQQRMARGEAAGFVPRRVSSPLVDPAFIRDARGGFELKHAAWLDTAAYLKASREFFTRVARVDTADVSPADIDATASALRWNGEVFASVVFCTGWEAMRHPWFDWVPFQPARGTILTAAADIGDERRIINGGCWFLKRPDGSLRIGSTYELSFNDPHGFDAAKLVELKQWIARLIPSPVTILEQQAAVRPIIARQRTLIGRHPGMPRVAFFNGLGSKGSLHSPYYSRLLCRHLLDDAPVPAACDMRANL